MTVWSRLCRDGKLAFYDDVRIAVMPLSRGRLPGYTNSLGLIDNLVFGAWHPP